MNIHDFNSWSEVSEYRNKVQEEAINALLAHNRGIVVLPPRFGKTRIAVEYLKKVGAQRTLIVVHGAQQKERWKDELKKWGYCCYAALTTYQYLSTRPEVKKRVDFDVIILDEVHHITNKNYNTLRQLGFKSIIGLTATYPDDIEKRSILYMLGLKIVYKKDIIESVNFKVNRNFRLYYIPVEPTDEEIEKYRRISRAGEEARTFEERKKIYIMRANYLYALPSKAKVVKQLYDMLKGTNYRGLTFVNSKRYGNKIDPARFLHSGKSKFVLEDLIRNYNNGDLNSLVILRVANEGIEFEDTDYIIFGSIHSSYIQFMQRLGRALNSITNRGTATVIVPVVMHTKEEDWYYKISGRVTKERNTKKIYDMNDILEIIKQNRNN